MASTQPVEVTDSQVNSLKEALIAHYTTNEKALAVINANMVVLPNTEKQGYSSIYRNSEHAKDGLAVYHVPEITNYYALFEAVCKIFPNNQTLGTRLFNNTKSNQYDDFYTFETYTSIRERKNNFGSGLVQVVTNHKEYQTKVATNLPHFDEYNNDKPYKFVVSIFSCNRKEWVLTDLACQSYNLVNTALYETLGPGTTSYIINLTKSPVVVSSGESIVKLLKLKKSDPGKLASLLVVISMDKLDIQKDYALYKLASSVGIDLYDMEQVEQLGKRNPVPLSPCGPNDLYTISFTSGTTGMPKGVVLSQVALMAAANFCMDHFGRIPSRNPFVNEIRYLSFLPLTHIYERQTFVHQISTGAKIGFPCTSVPVATLVDDMKILKPHFFISVPRVLTKLEATIKEIIDRQGAAKAAYIRSNIHKKIQMQKEKNHEKVELWPFDAIFTPKFRDAIGFSKVELATTGSAPISNETVKFLKAALNIGVRQGYGLTESFAGVFHSLAFEKDPGSCGYSGGGIEFRLRDLPAMNYVHDDPDGIPKGELMLRGPQIFKYYYKRPEETAKAFDEDGFFHTGDIAKIDHMNRIHIVDRVKNFFKLSQGEYITPERIENSYLSNCSLLTQMFVYGDSVKSYLVGILGFEPAVLKHFLQKHRKDDSMPKDVGTQIDKIIRMGNDQELFVFINGNKDMKRFLLKQLNTMVNAAKKPDDENLLQGFEKIHNFKADILPLKLEEDVVTPTFKLKRIIASKRFKKEIEELYKEGSLIKKDRKVKI